MQKKIYTVIRYVFGTAMTLFGIANIFQLLPPHNFPGDAGLLMSAFVDSGYILPAVGFTQLVLGVTLICNRYVPLALLGFAPVVVNVILFHIFLDFSSVMMALPIAVITIYLFAYHKSTFIKLTKTNNNENI